MDDQRNNDTNKNNIWDLSTKPKPVDVLQKSPESSLSDDELRNEYWRWHNEYILRATAEGPIPFWYEAEYERRFGGN